MTYIDSGWEMTRSDASTYLEPHALPADPSLGWIAAAVPGTVAGALRTAGADTNMGRIEQDDWWFRRRFNDPRAAMDEVVALAFDGLATIADVWLNGQHILHSDNMFIRHECDVGELLAPTNELVIRFASLQRALAERHGRGRWRTRLVEEQNLRFFRTTLLGRMPGWSPAPAPVGPWRAIAIEHWRGAHVRARALHARLDGTDGVLDATITLATSGARVNDAALVVAGLTQSVTVTPGAGDSMIEAHVRVPDVQRWWPHTHGNPALYDVSLLLTIDRVRTTLSLGRVGFRQVALATANDDFAIEVNGERIFSRGACWTPIDATTLNASESAYRDALTLARDAGMNMLRVSGNMVYEPRAFHDLCDELGILVWQDFMFANMDYPATDDEFNASVRIEAAQLLARIGGRASTALICGNSEVQQQAAMMGVATTAWASPLFDVLLPQLVETYAPGVPYWPSSPSGGVLPFHCNAGDAHYFGFGPYLRPQSDVRASDVRFASEALVLAHVPDPAMVDSLACGAAGAGHHPEWKRGVARDNGVGWDFEDVRDHYVAEMLHVAPMQVRYSDPERYLALGRAVSVELIERTMSEWRRVGSPCNGALAWTLRDVLPGAGWGLIDVAGQPKAAFHAMRRVSQSVVVVVTDEGLNGLHAHVINDTDRPIPGVLYVTAYLASDVVATAQRELVVPARGAVRETANHLLGSSADFTHAYRFGPPVADIVVVRFEPSHAVHRASSTIALPAGLSAIRDRATLRASAVADHDDVLLTVASDRTALSVAIDARAWRADDNYFHLAPNAEHVVRLVATAPRRPFRARISALNATTPVRVALT